MTRPVRVAAVSSHPIQYNAPFFALLAREPSIELTVLYASLLGAEQTLDPGFGITYAWDVPLLEGYNYKVVGTLGKTESPEGWHMLTPRIFTEIWRGRYDVVYMIGWGDWMTRLAIAACRLKRIPYMLAGDSAPIFPEPPLKGALKHIGVGWIVRNAAACLYMGALQRVFYERFGVPRERLFLHPWATETDRYFAASEEAAGRRAEIRAEFGLPAKIPLAVFSGKLIPRKRVHDLILAVKLLQETGIDCGAAIIGEGELRQELEALAAAQGVRNVVFLGFANQGSLPAIYTACDALVLPSEKDPRGVVINEAMCCGLPAVISHRAADWGPGDIVLEGVTGYIYFCGDVRALAVDCLEPLFTQPELRTRMGEAARKKMETWGMRERVDGTLAAIDFVMRDAGGGGCNRRRRRVRRDTADKRCDSAEQPDKR